MPDRLPLVLTRPQEQAERWLHALRVLGVAGLSLPVLHTQAEPNGVQEAQQQLGRADAAFFASPAAVAALWPSSTASTQVKPADGAEAQPWRGPALCVGPGTAAALAARGVTEVLHPPATAAQFDSEALWEVLSLRDWSGQRVLWLRGGTGRDWLWEQLVAKGAAVTPITVYTVRPQPPTAAELQTLLATPKLWVFSSALALDALDASPGGMPWTGLHSLATHERIASALRARGAQVRLCRPEPAAVAAAHAGWMQGLRRGRSLE